VKDRLREHIVVVGAGLPYHPARGGLLRRRPGEKRKSQVEV
jgi:hypothetical protein